MRTSKQTLIEAAKPQSPFSNEPIDAEIAPLIRALQGPDLVTIASCCGHGEQSAYVYFLVRGLEGIQRVSRRLERVQRAVPSAWITVEISYRHSRAAQRLLGRWPDWTRMTLHIEKSGHGGGKAYAEPWHLAPSKRLLSRLASLYRGAKQRD